MELFQSIQDNSSDYDQMLYDNNMQLMELQFYINNIARCLDIVDLLYIIIQYQKCNTIIKCDNIL